MNDTTTTSRCALAAGSGARWMVYHPDSDRRAPTFKTRKEAREACTRWNREACTGHIVIDLEKRPNKQI